VGAFVYGVQNSEDYVEFMVGSNGAEGPIGEENYLVLWSVENLMRQNEEYRVNEYAPGLFLFGSDGGGEGYGFDARSEEIRFVEIPLIGLDFEDAWFRGRTFLEFLKHLERGE
jgi:hypothetical protein